MKKTLTMMLLFGCVYLLSEVIFTAVLSKAWALKGHTSLWMGLVGSLVGLVLRHVHDSMLSNLNYKISVFLGAICITTMELISGLILNKWLGFNIWDYSSSPLNFMGQICISMSMVWLAITPAVYWVSDVVDHYMYDTEKPHTFVWYYLRVVFPDKLLYMAI